jgi:uncharacterized membrane protein
MGKGPGVGFPKYFYAIKIINIIFFSGISSTVL